MKWIRNWIAAMRRKAFTDRTEREIYLKLFPHLNGEADHGYPFADDDGLARARVEEAVRFRDALVRLERASRRMPEAEGKAFLFLAIRDLNERTAMHLQFAEERSHGREPAPNLASATA